MQLITKNILSFLKAALFVLVLTLGVVYAQAQWTDAPASPPNNNVPPPVNVGTVDQVKDAGLGLNALAVFGQGLFTGEVQIGNSGAACTSGLAGGMRYNSTDKTMEYCNGMDWTALGSSGGGGSTVIIINGDHSGQECIDAGGTPTPIGDGDYVCKFDSNSSCPVGWTQYQNWSTTQSRHCTYMCDYNGYLSNPVDVGCSSGGHSTFANTAREYCNFDCSGNGGQCFANVLAVGCY